MTFASGFMLAGEWSPAVAKTAVDGAVPVRR